ncbi:hypothetical protein G7Y89_g10243 [Cudoniella acicularis]|uniref:Uncharacterized protein n=1 Tax=Cudoniella acicularis TaxID=354080 RepID=A0A8H4RGV2_9HELO|nr:hypothetical protein G7Y89_g10243 [Cudoniella acicularis]
MSDFQWSSTEYDERWFHVLACLLARTQQQQNPERIIDTESSPYSKHESEDESDCDSDVEDVPITPRHLAKEKGKPGLLEKFLDRLAELLSREGIPNIDRKLAAVQAFCSTESDPAIANSVGHWTEIITICYELRYELSLLTYLEGHSEMRGRISQKALTLWRSLAYLGRLRSAYETFTEFAMQFGFVKTIDIQGVESSPPRSLGRYPLNELSQKLSVFGIDLEKSGSRFLRKTRMKEFKLERLLGEDQETDQFPFQHEMNKDLILARMTETERKVLEHLRPSFLELLAMESGDYGAIKGSTVSKDPTNPDMVLISSQVQVAALEEMDWQGFSSEQL